MRAHPVLLTLGIAALLTGCGKSSPEKASPSAAPSSSAAVPDPKYGVPIGIPGPRRQDRLGRQPGAQGALRRAQGHPPGHHPHRGRPAAGHEPQVPRALPGLGGGVRQALPRRAGQGARRRHRRGDGLRRPGLGPRERRGVQDQRPQLRPLPAHLRDHLRPAARGREPRRQGLVLAVPRRPADQDDHGRPPPAASRSRSTPPAGPRFTTCCATSSRAGSSPTSSSSATPRTT